MATLENHWFTWCLILLFSCILPIQFSSSDVSFLSVLFCKEANASVSSLSFFLMFSIFHGESLTISQCFMATFSGVLLLWICFPLPFYFLVVSPIKPSSDSSLSHILRRQVFFWEREFHWNRLRGHTPCALVQGPLHRGLCT